MEAKTDIKLIKELKVIKPDEIVHIESGEVNLGLVLEWQVADTKTGKITDHGIIKSKSFVQQFIQLLWLKWANTSYNYPLLNVRDTTNNLRSMKNYFGNFKCDAGAGVVLTGIIVGTGNAAPTISDYALQTPIAHGIGGGQLQYGAVSFGAPAADATTSQFTITRNFANGSGGAIVVQEAGLYVYARDSGGTGRYFMTIRDITGGINVPNGQTLTLNYRPQAVA